MKLGLDPPPLHPLKRILPEISFDTLSPLTSTDTGQLILNRKCYQGSEPEIVLHMINIIYAALPMCGQTDKTTFSCKDY